MRRLLSAVVALAAAAAGAHASFCIDGYPTLEREYAEAYDVIDAKVVRIKMAPYVPFIIRHGKRVDPADRVTFTILRSYKHRLAGRFSFDNIHSSANFPVDVGKRYLVFVSRRPKTGKYYVDTCGSSHLYAHEPAATLHLLDRLSER